MPRLIFILPVFLLPFHVKSQTADFTFQSSNGVFCNPSNITFTQNCTGSPTGFIWDFGNNTMGYSAVASATYATAGTFTVKLTAIYDQTSSEIIKTIVINPTILPAIGYDRNYICIPGAINFIGNSNGNIANYTWDFGDTTGIINSSTKDIAHNYANFGNYQVTLKVTDINGCTGTASTPIKVNKPAIAATASPTSGCIPADVNFNANVNLPLNGAVSSYSWNYDDGSPINTTATNNTSHSYPLVGSYTPTLSIITNEGCTNTFNFPAIAFGTPPINHIAYPKKNVVCGSETPLFVAKATDANRYRWVYGDGTTAFTNDTLISHKYTTLGFKTLSVTPFFNGCGGTTISFQIEVVGVIAKYVYSNTCANKKTYSFTNTSLGNLSSTLWNFGDNSSTVTTTNAIHNFPATGQFATTLTITDSITGCSDNFSRPVYTADPVLVNTDSSICKYVQTVFTITNNYTNSGAIYNWNIVGLKIAGTSNSTIGVNANKLGIYNNFVSINYGPQSCLDTIQLDHPIIVKGPDLNFVSPDTLCFNNPVSIINLSKPFIAVDSVSLWYWNYGDRITNDTIYQPLTFQYQNAGTYQIKLIAFDIRGCKDSLTKIVIINPLPFLRVVPQIDTMCLGQPVAIQTFSNSNFLWTPAATLSCNSCDSAVANPAITTKYYVKATTRFNCIIDDSVLIKVYAPFSAVSPANNYYICRNDNVQLDIGPKAALVTWSPATGLSSATSFTPIAAPQQSTSYLVTLIDSVGCFSDSIVINVIVKSLPVVDAGADKILPYNSSFTITPAYSNNVVSYAWTPAVQLFCNNCASPTGTALNSETYIIKVISDSGCVANDNISIFVECKNTNILLPKAFTPNNDNLNDYYYPITRGIKSITKFLIYNREGKVVYEAKNFLPNSKSFAWNGTYKGQFQPLATYVYILEAICDQGQILTQKGSFLLLR